MREGRVALTAQPFAGQPARPILQARRQPCLQGRDTRAVEPPKARKSVQAEVNWGVRRVAGARCRVAGAVGREASCGGQELQGRRHRAGFANELQGCQAGFTVFVHAAAAEGWCRLRAAAVE